VKKVPKSRLRVVEPETRAPQEGQLVLAMPEVAEEMLAAGRARPALGLAVSRMLKVVGDVAGRRLKEFDLLAHRLKARAGVAAGGDAGQRSAIGVRIPPGRLELAAHEGALPLGP
jgi:hypothetical protein